MFRGFRGLATTPGARPKRRAAITP